MRIVVASALDKLNSITRLWETIRYLSTQPHEWHVVGSGKAFETVEEAYPDSFGINYPRIFATDEEREALLWEHNSGLEYKLKRFRPHVMLLDGEYLAAQVAQKLQIPILSIDPQHLFQFGRFDITIPPTQFEQLLEVKEDIKKHSVRANHYLMPTFVNASFRTTHAQVTQPVQPLELQDQETTIGDHVLAFAWPALQQDLDLFSHVEQKVIAHLPMRKKRHNRDRVLFEREVSGSEGQVIRRRKQKLPQELDRTELENKLPASTQHITYKLAEHESWSADILDARAVVIDGNPITIAEAITLKKPMLVIPKPENFPQWCFSQHVEHLGLGEHHPRMTRAVLEGFLNRLDRYHENLADYRPTSPTYFEALHKALKGFDKQGPQQRKDDPPKRQRKAVAGNREE